MTAKCTQDCSSTKVLKLINVLNGMKLNWKQNKRFLSGLSSKDGNLSVGCTILKFLITFNI